MIEVIAPMQGSLMSQFDPFCGLPIEALFTKAGKLHLDIWGKCTKLRTTGG